MKIMRCERKMIKALTRRPYRGCYARGKEAGWGWAEDAMADHEEFKSVDVDLVDSAHSCACARHPLSELQ